MKEFKVVIPEESYSILQFKDEGLPGVAVVNTALREFEPKEVFGWHLSIFIDLEEVVDNGMPTESEMAIVEELGDRLDALMKGSNPAKPNALFLARVTWNSSRHLVWRVFDVELADQELKEIIETNDTPRQFEYEMEYDEEWKFTHWFLKDHSKE